MKEKYVVRLSAEEREELKRITKKLSGSSQKVRRANILLMTDADGPNWVDTQIAEAFSCQVRTIEKLRKRLVTKGFQEALNGKQRESPPRKKKLDGRQEARVIPRKPTQSLSPTWKRFSKSTSNLMFQAFPWFAWMNNLFS